MEKNGGVIFVRTVKSGDNRAEWPRKAFWDLDDAIKKYMEDFEIKTKSSAIREMFGMITSTSVVYVQNSEVSWHVVIRQSGVQDLFNALRLAHESKLSPEEFQDQVLGALGRYENHLIGKVAVNYEDELPDPLRTSFRKLHKL